MTETANTISLEALKAGDREAFARLVDETSQHIYRVALQILGNDQDAEDVLQETYIKAFRALPDFEGRSSLTTWLYRIAVNEALMQVRKRKPQPISVEENTPFDAEAESETMEIVDFCCLPEGELLSSESRRFLDQAVQNLPANLRMVFVMRDLEGLSIQETAEALSLSENNVKTRLLRARLRLRQELSVYFGQQNAGGKPQMSEHVHTPQCKQLLGSLSDYIDGELQAELCAEIEEHIQDCDNCRIVIDTLRKTVELYEQIKTPADLPDGVRERLFFKLELADYLKKV